MFHSTLIEDFNDTEGTVKLLRKLKVAVDKGSKVHHPVAQGYYLIWRGTLETVSEYLRSLGVSVKAIVSNGETTVTTFVRENYFSVLNRLR